ncbi:MAG: LuxR C-terminal-related transcriptional regulator, partial [Ilumatobacteraceae bacterium]
MNRIGPRASRLSPREFSALALMASGLSNEGIAGQLSVSAKTVESMVSSIFRKLDLFENSTENRRVRAVRVFLDEMHPASHTRGRSASLPVPRTSLIGRAAVVEDVVALLASSRLVTLTGVGGGGKTRVAIEVAHHELAVRSENVWFVDLAPARTADELSAAFVVALGMGTNSTSTVIGQLESYLRERHGLLIVDNCEHMIVEAARLVDAVLAACAHIRVLATSREPLNLDGERSWRLPSLDLGVGSSAVQLFVERAMTAVGESAAGFDASALPIVADICEQLDGIPLAIELTAALVRTMTVADIRRRVDDRFRLLPGASGREGRLELAVRSSYDSLAPDAQMMLRRLSVFRGGFALGDVSNVVGVATLDSIALLDRLVTKSLVEVVRTSDLNYRYRLLETIRLFGLACMDEAEASEVRDRHLDHFLADPLVTCVAAGLEIDGAQRMNDELANFIAAAEWSLASRRPAGA